MNDLANRTFLPVDGSSVGLNAQEIKTLAEQLPLWDTLEVNSEIRLQRVYKFKNFNQAISFADQVAKIADEADHHPSLLVEWGKVTVTWWTHVIHGLHQNDFIMAARTDRLYEKPQP
jgi:4a-hydroxytetrahydrobiopterin dehydratase